MADPEPPASESALSFERAEFESEVAPGLACAFCRSPLHSQYWEITRRPACDQCRVTVQSQVATSLSAPRFLRALGYGALAAAAGCTAWIVVTRVTGYEIGLVAVGIGYLVGKAVRKGAGGFGGTRYQVLALTLTYAAITLASLPAVLEVVAHPSDGHAAATRLAAHASVSVLGLVWACLVVVGIALASPFLQGAENILGIFILGIGLYEAWKLTRALPIPILGPFSIQQGAPVRAAIEPSSHSLAADAAD